MSLAIYPGTFDPFTKGHLDILERAILLFDEVEVTVAVNVSKSPLLSLQERCELVQACTEGLAGVSVASFDGLLMDHARRREAVAVIRGLRQVTDFDYEYRMLFANRRLHPTCETVFLMPSESHALIHASLVREIHRLGGDISSFVPAPVLKTLQAKK